VAPDRVPADQRPTTWAELAGDRWRGRLAMADPRFGTTRTHVAAMKVVWDRRAMPGFYESWLDGLAENGVQVLTSGNAGVVQAVIDGSADLGMTDSDDVIAFRRQGAEIDWIFPRHFADPRERDGGTLLIPNAVGLVAGSTRVDAARALIEFLLSPEVEAMLRDSPSGNWPLGPGVAPPGSLDDPSRPLAVDAPLAVDWTIASRAADAAVEAAIARVGAPGERPRRGGGGS
jgi:iron(III) transport system substrate-binding protein